MTTTDPPPIQPIHRLAALRRRYHLPRLRSPLRWSTEGPGTALACLPAIAIPLMVAISLGAPAAGLVAAGGALSVGFGAFQQLSHSRALPMFLAGSGMALAALLGSLLGSHALAFAAVLAVFAGFCGLVTTLGAGAWWSVLQWVIALLVAGSRPGGIVAGFERAILVLAGGGIQILIMSSVWKLKLLPEAVTHPLPRAPLRTAGRLLRRHFSLHAPAGRYALILALSVGGLDLIARRINLPNGYWAPMTLLILLKPAFRDTVKRGVQRIFGTLAGAGVATLAVALLKPGEWVESALVVSAAFGSYALLRVNYLAYSVCITAYVAFLLSLAGTPEPVVAADRVIGTLAGGLMAMLVHSGWSASELARIRAREV